LFHHCMRSQPN